MKKKQNEAQKMIYAILIVQIFSMLCIVALKYNMDHFIENFRNQEARYFTVMYDLEDISGNVYLHENYVLKDMVSAKQEAKDSYREKEQELEESITSELKECDVAIRDLDNDTQYENFKEMESYVNAYLQQAEKTTASEAVNEQPQNLEDAEGDLLYYIQDVNSSMTEIETYAAQELSTIKEQMSDSITYIKIYFTAGILGIFIGTIICLTYCSKLLRAQNRYMEEAQTASSAKTVFLSNMSHEIRTPINTVIGLNEMIIRREKNAEILGYARDVQNAGNMLLALVNSILDLSKIEAGRMELIPVEYAVASLVNDVRSIIKPKADEKGLGLEIDVSETLPSMLIGDDVKLKQILINILTNACKYTELGYVKLCIYGEVDGETANLYFSVKDTGIGMTPEDLQKVAVRFSRFDEKKNHDVEGTGIGMDITCTYLRMMGSELEVESIYGEGSDFHFRLTQKVVDRTPVGNIGESLTNVNENEEYEVTFVAPTALVLVVDDNAMNLNVFTHLLEETQIQIDTASSGFEALDLTKEKKYDLIYMDHMMPEMDGMETFEKLHNQEDGLNRETPVVCLTANALSGAREEYMALGFTDFLAKPIKPDRLEEMTRTLLPDEKLEESLVLKAQDDGKHSGNEPDIELPDIEGIDWDYAAEHSGSVDTAMSMMKNFIHTARGDEETLTEFYKEVEKSPGDEKAITDFRIRIHSMKSSAGIFGALQVYGAAAHLEFLAREENAEGILASTPYFLIFWEKLIKDLEDAFPEEVQPLSISKKPLNPEVVMGLLNQLTASMKVYDVAGADDMIQKLGEFDLGPESLKLFNDLKDKVLNLDALGCEEVSGQIKALTQK